jgi:two-component system, sensor histidine kinase YesM
MNTFRRVMMVFLVLMVPIYIIAFSLFSTGSNEIKRQIGHSVANHISLFMSSLEKDLTGIQQQKFTAFDDNNLQMLSNRPLQVNDYDIVRAMRDLQQRLFAIKNSSAYVEGVTVYIRDLGKLISSFPRIEDYAEPEIADLLSVATTERSPVVFIGDTPYFVDVFPRSRAPSDTAYDFLFLIRLSTVGLRESIRTMSRSFGGSTALVHPPSGFVLTPDGRFEQNSGLSLAVVDHAAGRREGQFEHELPAGPHVGFYGASAYADLILVQFMEERNLYTPLREYVRFFWLLSVASLSVIIVAALFTHRLLHRPLGQLVDAFHSLERWDLSARIDANPDTEFGYLFSSFNRMIAEINRLIGEKYETGLLLQKARYNQLQAQINPHFLYNSFFILQRRIRNEDLEGAEEMCAQLGKYYEYVTHNELQDVPLVDEIEHAKRYADIQRVRFGPRITVEFGGLPEPLSGLQVPRLIVQPLVENAFKHGLENRSEGGRIRIRFDAPDDGLRIVVDDNGAGLSPERRCALADAMNNQRGADPVSGIINIHRRLQLRYGPSSGLSLEPSPEGGLRVILNISATDEGPYA